MIVNAFYNAKGVGDVLIVETMDVPLTEQSFERKGNVARIYREKTNELAGYNFFEASSFFKAEKDGPVELTEKLVAELNEVIRKAGFEDELEVDLSPKFVVGYVAEKEKHPNADKLSICKVAVGEEELQIVCGAPNVEAGQKVVVAKVGAVMPSGLVIKPSNLRGVDSFGMLCAARELAIPNAPQEKGILVLEDGYETGAAFPVSF
ncbi:YtpR family tRNA-binding protein [Listeria grayi]|uniref:tRNA binding domain protein n=1 Tax=Listeria grayi DSM 20601 TaxID=525367 RepID=D7UYS1_LISGR|nr:DUF4479 family protein [Listeria grayi]EFI83488.1 tRNA binding domain protein [Listeria grayi DSM 20601]